MNQEKDDELDIPPLSTEELKKARRVTPSEHEEFRKGLERKFGTPFPSPRSLASNPNFQ